jgi:hypothetical protein
MAQPIAVKLNVYSTDQNFKVLRTGYVFTPDCQDAFCTGMDVAEDRLNPEQDLFVDPQLTHYLYLPGAGRPPLEPGGCLRPGRRSWSVMWPG